MTYALFPTGKCYMTPKAQEMIEQAGEEPTDYLDRHVRLEQGELDDEDQAANLEALRTGTRILSAFVTSKKDRLWIITEWDRSATTILVPDEY